MKDLYSAPSACDWVAFGKVWYPASGRYVDLSEGLWRRYELGCAMRIRYLCCRSY